MNLFSHEICKISLVEKIDEKLNEVCEWAKIGGLRERIQYENRQIRNGHFSNSIKKNVHSVTPQLFPIFTVAFRIHCECLS